MRAEGEAGKALVKCTQCLAIKSGCVTSTALITNVNHTSVPAARKGITNSSQTIDNKDLRESSPECETSFHWRSLTSLGGIPKLSQNLGRDAAILPVDEPVLLQAWECKICGYRRKKAWESTSCWWGWDGSSVHPSPWVVSVYYP